MASTWLSPHESWPPHDRDSANEAFDYAKAHGWWFKPSDKGHLFGTMTCCEPTGEIRLHEVCNPRIARSARGDPEETAQFIRRQVRNCPHDWAEPDDAIQAGQRLAREKFEVLLGLLGKVDALIAAYERLLEAEGSATRRDELLEMMVDVRDEAIAAYGEAERAAIEAEQQAAELREHARQSADSASLGGPPWPPPNPSVRLLDPASHYLEIAQSIVEGKTGEAASLAKERLDERCRRVRELRESR